MAALLLVSAAGDDPEGVFREVAPHARLGLLVVDEGGREVAAIRPDERFMPASNTKMFTVAAAFATLDVEGPDGAGASVRLEPREGRPPDVVLAGHGDARLSGADDCREDCLRTLADAVAAKVRVVGDVIGDDSFFPDERWPQGMSWNNIPTRSGTGVSALTMDDNELVLSVSPANVGEPPRVEGAGYYTLDNRALTVARGRTALDWTRAPDGRVVRLTGTMAAGAAAVQLRLGIDDPAEHAAWRLAAMLSARGVRVTGRVAARHRPVGAEDDPSARGGAVPVRAPEPATLARVTPGPLIADLTQTMKVSQNLHAELLLRRIGRVRGTGSVADGQAAVAAMLARAGVGPAEASLADGSGMSTYNRVTPRASVRLLRWAAGQRWAGAWRSTLPVGGVDGTLARRFRGTLLEGRIFAKTGSLNATAALAGTMVAKSGRTLTFAAYANDVPEGENGAAGIDRALVAIAAAH